MAVPQPVAIRMTLFLLFASACATAEAAATVTFTVGDEGTYPQTLEFDRQTQVLTVNLSAVPRNATIFRAELILAEPRQFAQPAFEPTNVYPVDQPEQRLPLVAPRYVGLDAVGPVRAAVRAGKPLRLKLETTLAGAERLEVSYLEAEPKTKDVPAVAQLDVTHRKGQSLVVFREPHLADYPDFKTGEDVGKFKAKLAEDHPGMTFRIWRCPVKITTETIARAQLVGECGLMTAWNDTYHQDDTKRKPPVRYRVRDGGDAVPWGSGVYAHNPDQPGRAYYAVSVALGGEEDFDRLGDGNTIDRPVEETVGIGAPVLQWVERLDEEEGWHYRRNRIVRLIYTRWESWPHASRPSVPLDYLVVIPLEPLPEGPIREPQYKAYRIEGPAPVGLHLHAWGGSLNGGYGWWYNGHRGAVLIASNQIPYDWWTGYHESRGTRKTLGDGRVRPFTMNRTFGFLDWASRQAKEAPEAVRPFWPELDLSRVFTAGNSMGGSGAPMFGIRYGDRIAWSLGWVGVHVPEESPQFKSSYLLCYGPRHKGIAMPDGETSPWDYFSDVWWLGNHVAADTGLIIASNGKNDGGIGWEQAYHFARALQETRRPHLFNWACGGHGSHTRVGPCFDLDVRSDRTLPAFTRCSLDDDVGTARRKTDQQIEAEKRRQADEVRAGKRREVRVDPFDGDPVGQYNAYLRWQTDDVVDAPDRWAMTVVLTDDAPQDRCTVDLTPRRCQRFRPRPGERFVWTSADLEQTTVPSSGEVTADQWGLVTVEKLRVVKPGCRVTIARK